MNDRASQRPPVPYIGEHGLDTFNEEPRGRGMTRSGQFTHFPNMSVAESSIADRSDSSRSSGLFRFGKSLAATFNPSNWKIWSKQPRVVEETSQEKILRERRAKAEKLYQELKAAGDFENHTRRASSQQPHENFSGNTSRRRSTSQQPRERNVESKHDSGVSFDSQGSERRMSFDSAREGKRHGKIFVDPPKMPYSSASPAPGEGGLSPTKRRSFNFKKPSLSNLNRPDSDQGSDSGYGDHQAKRMPSKKDLQKQQKLVKRVSDLESKLDAARRQLNDTLHEPLPQQVGRIGRPRFVPGALSTLPSERLLAGYVQPDEDDDEVFNGIGQAVTTDEALIAGQLGVSDLREESEPEHVKQEAKRSSRQMSEQPQLDKSLPPSPDIQEPQPSLSEMVQPSIEATLATEVKADEASPPTRKLSNKRKMPHTGIADDGGLYRPPPDTESDYDSDIKASKKQASRPRKVQKKTASVEALSPVSKTVATKKVTIKKPTVHTPPPKHKSKIPRKSASPPPPSNATVSFTGGGLEYKKPSSARGAAKAAEQRKETAHGSDKEEVVPPLPTMPKAVRLASGEVVDIDAARKAGTGGPVAKSGNIKSAPASKKGEGKKQTGVENEDTGGEKQQGEGDEWPDYVF